MNKQGGGDERAVPEDCQADVDEEISAAAGDEEDANGRDCPMLVLH